ncbi:hypothetical protein DNL40_10320 [Xylanimonas oleitrophica]|uniref:Uncharacterized protein n=1 Tax=Xylanimonas oleitrophica TaxID=2607479 RepID=A0A2W5WYE0_9MICO|nr:hypothetical protein DNL40_10320 [Xylanimonas oleitrophica]
MVALAVLVWVVTLTVSVGGGTLVVPWVLRRTEKEPEVRAEAARVLAGGTWIGLLERAGVAMALLAGYPEGIALAVAVKGLGRLHELRDHPHAGERFVVGTLASLIWAGAVGLAGRAVLLLVLP